MPSLVRKVASQIKAKYNSTQNKTESAKDIEARIDKLRAKTRQATASNKNLDKAIAEREAREKQAALVHSLVAKKMSYLSRKAAKQQPMTVSRRIEFDMESLPFNASRMSDPSIFNIEVATGVSKGTPSDMTLRNIENQTLGIRTQTQPRPRQQGRTITIHLDSQGKAVNPQPKRKKQPDWQDTLNNL